MLHFHIALFTEYFENTVPKEIALDDRSRKNMRSADVWKRRTGKGYRLPDFHAIARNGVKNEARARVGTHKKTRKDRPVFPRSYHLGTQRFF